MVNFSVLSLNLTSLRDLSYEMTFGFDLLGVASNIVSILGELTQRVQRCGKLEWALLTAEASTKGIEKTVLRLGLQHEFDEVQAEILQEMQLELENTREQLLAIVDKALNRLRFRKLLLCPEILAQIHRVRHLLTNKDDTLKSVEMVGALNIEHGSDIA